MAKKIKLEDYWKQHNVELILKGITSNLVEQTPDDPVLGIFQYLKKKFPKSFSSFVEEKSRRSSTPRSVSGNVQNAVSFSNRSAVDLELTTVAPVSRRSSVNQTENRPLIPNLRSAFLDLNEANISAAEKSESLAVLRNVINADRLTQHVVRLGRDVRSKRDLIEDEMIVPDRSKRNSNFETKNFKENFFDENKEFSPICHQQIIGYKQEIRQQNELRAHQEKLAALAIEMNQQENLTFSSNEKSKKNVQSQIGPKESKTKVPSKEAAFLNDEIDFGSSSMRNRENQINRNSLNFIQNLRADRRSSFLGSMTMKLFNPDRLTPTEQRTCRNCGATVLFDDEPIYLNNEPGRLNSPSNLNEPSAAEQDESVIVDDWFQDPLSAPSISNSPHSSQPRQSPELSINTNSLISTNHRRLSEENHVKNDSLSAGPLASSSHFQPISRMDSPPVSHRPPSVPTILINDRNSSRRRSTKPSIETEAFARLQDSPSLNSSMSKTSCSTTARQSPDAFFTSPNMNNSKDQRDSEKNRDEDDPFDQS